MVCALVHNGRGLSHSRLSLVSLLLCILLLSWLNASLHVKESSWYRAAATTTVLHKTKAHTFNIRHADMGSFEFIICKTKTIVCLLSLRLFVCMCVCVILNVAVWQHRTRQTDAARAVRPLWNAPALKRFSWELYCVGRVAAASTMSVVVVQHHYLFFVAHYCTWEERVSKSPFNELQVCACHKMRNELNLQVDLMRLFIEKLLVQKIFFAVLALRKCSPQNLIPNILN